MPTNIKISQASKIAGGLIGLLVGDALGVPYEFHHKDTLPKLDNIEFVPPQGFNRSHNNVAPGTWSDDGAQALCLLASLLHCNKLDMQDFATRMLNWYEYGYMAVDHHVFDVGNATARGLNAFKDGTSPLLSGGLDEDSHGNGALMRVLPLALWHRGSDLALIEDAGRQACVTHAQPRSQLCCALYCLTARALLHDSNDPWGYAVEKVYNYAKNNERLLAELECSIRPMENIEPEGSGYVVDSLRAARKALSFDDYQSAVRYGVSLGDDTDTTAAIMGGISGIKLGLGDIPVHWFEDLRGKSIYKPLLDQLLLQVA
ncbi:ADP-ribosylglycohydrolase family protein [Bartonella sp. HY406]|uniref:ADP-ribosylglycohydrolase family protein n=1 Tax=Bartonella sp. HY406 TaxID=2979331 RepID=UPI0021C8F9B7|nr:ADP-ribosylglycohydrolase family protein [Bartonella sp. HY406]UXN03087.1 ADP-ribosylglycohydrolase family protein [Bartonella sp. HY406]